MITFDRIKSENIVKIFVILILIIGPNLFATGIAPILKHSRVISEMKQGDSKRPTSSGESNEYSQFQAFLLKHVLPERNEEHERLGGEGRVDFEKNMGTLALLKQTGKELLQGMITAS